MTRIWFRAENPARIFFLKRLLGCLCCLLVLLLVCFFDIKGILVDDRAFYGCIIALCLLFTGHPFLAVFLFILVC